MGMKNERYNQTEHEGEQLTAIREFWGALASVTHATERWSRQRASELDRIALQYVEAAAEERIRPLAEAVGRGEIDLDSVRSAPEFDELEVHSLLDGAPKLLESRTIVNLVQDVDIALLRDPAFALRRAEVIASSAQ